MRSNFHTPHLALVIVVALVGGALTTAETRWAPRFLVDDPRPVDDDTRVDASGATRRDLGRLADFVINAFGAPGDRRDVPAQNVNSLDEVPDSSWFTNRLGQNTMSIEDVVGSSDRVPRLAVQQWVVIEGKSVGRQPGFRAIDAADPTRTLYQIEFDPRSNPEMATGAEIIGTAIYHAAGYHVVENYLIDLDASTLIIAPDATIDVAGRSRPFTRRDLNTLLRGVARKPDGRYRATASRFAEGRYLGPFRYYGTRPDDPNDIVPHEHRRELRGNRVFAAWLNHDDSRAGNSLDMLVGTAGRRYVKHYMFDFGSILGSGTNDQDHPWVGSEYLVEPRPGLRTLSTLGLWRRPFILVQAGSDLPAAGNFTADGFDPMRWKQHYPNQAFRNLQPEDAFWAARIVAAFTPESIAAIVQKAAYSDPRATDYITGTLLKRRERVLRQWLAAMNPVGYPSIDGAGVLRFENSAVTAGLIDQSSEYAIGWFSYDNDSGIRTPVSEEQIRTIPAAPVPVDLQHADYAGVEVRTRHRDYPQWNRPVRFYIRRDASGWTPVGVERGESTARPAASLAAR